jgi:hypothetical protein
MTFKRLFCGIVVWKEGEVAQLEEQGLQRILVVDSDHSLDAKL